MKKGDIINGYRILDDFTTAGGGLSKWTFATKGTETFFIKEFLAPTYPTTDSPGSESTKAAKRKQCDQFELRHRTLMAKLAGKSSVGGNLVVTTDFFRSGAKYYKVTAKVDVKGLTKAEIARLPWDKQRLILLTVAHSVKILHYAGVVHGDLKPDNILIKEQTPGVFVAKLIDFDDSYLSGHPPVASDEVVGDQVYYSPELLKYVTRSREAVAANLELPSDVFALGLIYVEYLAGTLPRFDGKYRYACEAMVGGGALVLPEMRAPIGTLLEGMLQLRPYQRPTINEVFDALKASRPGLPAAPVTFAGPLMKKVSRRDAPAAPPSGPIMPPPSDPPPASRLKGTLLKRRT